MTLINDLDAKIYLALKDRLDTMPGGYTIVESSETFSTSAEMPFLVVQDVRLDVNRRFTGSDDPDYHTGLFNIAVMVPLSWTYTQGLGVAGDIRNHFTKGLALIYDDAVVTVDQTPRVNGNPYRDGAFMRFPVSVPWRCQG